MFRAEVVNTLHWIPTGRFRKNKKGELKEIKRKVIHRRLFLTALPGAVLIALPSNLRIVLTHRGYSLSGRKETEPAWYERDMNGKKPAPKVAKEYTRLKGVNGKDMPSMNRLEVLAFLTANIGPLAVDWLMELETGEPLEGDERWTALEKYGYERPVYEEEEEAIAA